MELDKENESLHMQLLREGTWLSAPAICDMTKDHYDTLSYKEKAIYDEFTNFSKTLLARIDALTKVTQALLDEATKDISEN